MSRAFVVDSHCHLDFDGLHDDLALVLQRARDQDVGLILSISSRAKKFDRLRQIIDENINIYGTIGTHPHNAHEELDLTVADYVALARHPKVIGIGEAGLDQHYDYSPLAAQEQGFRTQIAAARETGLPLIIHTREAEDNTARVLDDEMAKGAFKAVLHCFTSADWLAKKAVELGLYVSFSGILTYKTAENLRDTARGLPEDRILVETDAPYLAPVPYRGKSNEPAFVRKTLEVMAETRGVSVDHMARATSDNFFRLFSKANRPAGFV